MVQLIQMDRYLDYFLDFVTPVVLWFAFGIALVIFLISNVALSYHWKNYSMNAKRSSRIMRAFRIVSVVLLGIMFLSVLTYSI